MLPVYEHVFSDDIPDGTVFFLADGFDESPTGIFYGDPSWHPPLRPVQFGGAFRMVARHGSPRRHYSRKVN